MTDVFQALAAPQSRRIIEALAASPLTKAALIKETKLTEASIAKHAAVLLEAQLVKVEKKGRTETYSLNRAGFSEAAKWFGKVGSANLGARADDLAETLGELGTSLKVWLEKKLDTKIEFNIDVEEAGKELGKKLSDAKQGAKKAAKKAKAKAAAKTKKS
jgi:DNA-binding transcriptional ArsR family regulator